MNKKCIWRAVCVTHDTLLAKKMVYYRGSSGKRTRSYVTNLQLELISQKQLMPSPLHISQNHIRQILLTDPDNGQVFRLRRNSKSYAESQ